MVNKKEGKKVSPRKKQAVKEPTATASLKKKLKAADPEVRDYVSALHAKIRVLEKDRAKLQAENITLYSRIAAWVEQYEEKKGEVLAEIFANAAEQLKKAGIKKRCL